MMKHKWSILFVTTLVTGLAFFDNTVMPVALPAIQNDFAMSSTALIWIVNSYLLTFMSLMLVGGKLSDRFGVRKIYQWGLMIFALGTLLGGLSTSSSMLIVGRVIQGIGAAFNTPATGALILQTFPLGSRGKAIGINTGISSLFLVLGPPLGGLLTEYLNWHYIFWMHFPFIIAAFIVMLWMVPKQEARKEKFSFSEAMWLAASVSGLVIGLMQGPEWGWTSEWTFLSMGIGCVCFLFFLRATRLSPYPLIDRDVLKQSLFRRCIVCIYLTQFLVMATVFWAIYFQKELAFLPAKTGIIMMGGTAPVFFVAPLGGWLADRFGPRLPISLGFFITLLSLLCIGLSPIQHQIGGLIVGVVLFGAGIPLILSPAVATSMTYVPKEKLGGASAMTIIVRQFASTTGIAVMSALFFTIFQKTFSFTWGFKVVSLFAAAIAFIGFIFAFIAFDQKQLVKTQHKTL